MVSGEEGGRLLLSSPQTVAGAKNVRLKKGGLVEAPFKRRPFKFNKSLCSSLCERVLPSHAQMHTPVLNVASRRKLSVCCEVFRNYIIGEVCEFVLRWLKNASPRITVIELDGFL